LFGGERPVLACTFVDKNLSPVVFDVSDTFELNVDKDFSLTDFTGTTNAAYSGAVASIAGTFTEDISTAYTTGYIMLRDKAGSRERVAYTDLVVTGAGPYVGTFTVSKTLDNVYVSGSHIELKDELMSLSTEADVNVSGDWTEADKALGKISIRVDCTSYEFITKVQQGLQGFISGQRPDVPVYLEIKRYPAGGVDYVILLQDIIYARPSIKDIN
jgi:hypothetical protein